MASNNILNRSNSLNFITFSKAIAYLAFFYQTIF